MSFVELLPGDPAPWFRQRSTGNPRYVFDTAAGRWLVLCFFGSRAHPHAGAAISAVESRRDLFNDAHASFFGVSVTPADEVGLREIIPGCRHFLDFDLTVSRAYGAVAKEGGASAYRPMWLVIDPTLRVHARIPFRADHGDIAELIQLVANLPPPDRATGTEMHAPVVMLPNVFPLEFCKRLIELYEAAGGEDSGFMVEENGRTVLKSDAAHKRRRDHMLADAEAMRLAQALVHRRIVPAIHKAHQFNVTRMERYLVACYDAADQAHFRQHRDNTTKGTAHRRFAVSINLNADFEGGDLMFPEYGRRTFRPAPGAAVVFSCSLLHAVAPVTKGRRYAFLPFLYDEAAAQLRTENLKFVGTSAGTDQPT